MVWFYLVSDIFAIVCQLVSDMVAIFPDMVVNCFKMWF